VTVLLPNRKAAAGRVRIVTLLADADYDAEWVHEHVREYGIRTDKDFVTAIEGTLELNIQFSRVAEAAAEMQNFQSARILCTQFERILKGYYLPRGVGGHYGNHSFDFHKFLRQELFVTMIVPLLRYERWEMIQSLLGIKLMFENHPDERQNLVPYHTLSTFLFILDYRNSRLQSNRVSLHADLLKERHSQGALGEQVPFEDFMEADLFLHLQSAPKAQDSRKLWWPWSSLYSHGAPKFLSRAIEAEYALNLLGVLVLPNYEQLKSAVVSAKKQRIFDSPHFIHPFSRFNADEIATR
jgi:hypothetical protein